MCEIDQPETDETATEEQNSASAAAEQMANTDITTNFGGAAAA